MISHKVENAVRKEISQKIGNPFKKSKKRKSLVRLALQKEEV